MTLLVISSAVAFMIGTVLPISRAFVGFVAAAALLFLAQVVIRTAMGFEGTPLSETMLLFNNSWSAYIGYNLQIALRSFALPLLSLATPLIFRLGRQA